MTQWLWSYVSAERGARLITGLHSHPKHPLHMVSQGSNFHGKSTT